jgi:hypothetical protein
MYSKNILENSCYNINIDVNPCMYMKKQGQRYNQISIVMLASFFLGLRDDFRMCTLGARSRGFNFPRSIYSTPRR